MMIPSTRLLYAAPLAFAALAALPACSGKNDDVPTYATCTESFEAVYLPGTDATGTTWPSPGAMRTAGDTLIVQLDDYTLRAFPPNGAPTNILAVNPNGSTEPDYGTLSDFFPDGSSLVLVMTNGVYRMPLTGGALTPIATATEAALILGDQARVKDATTIYAAGSGTDAAGRFVLVVDKQSLAGGASTPVASILVSQLGTFGQQLFDQGDWLWLADSYGDVFSITKSTGAVSGLGRVQGAGFLFGPNGTSGFYGSNADTSEPESFALAQRGAAWTWPGDAPEFLTHSYAEGLDGTAYFGGEAFLDAQRDVSASALVVVPPGQSPTSIAHCGSPGSGIVRLAPGDTFVYAQVYEGGQFGEIVRIPK
jgi:hypothetical protein